MSRSFAKTYQIPMQLLRLEANVRFLFYLQGSLEFCTMASEGP